MEKSSTQAVAEEIKKPTPIKDGKKKGAAIRKRRPGGECGPTEKLTTKLLGTYQAINEVRRRP